MEQDQLIATRSLLGKVSRIERHSAEVARLRHENYNIFSLLRKDHDEEHLHSAFIADLLDPRGSHEMGTVFAELFFREIAVDFPLAASTYVTTEKALPVGRADIFLKTGSCAAIIENKIYAADQPEQLGRYHDYLQDQPKQGVLLYLTLDGKPSKEAEAFNEADENADRIIQYSCISYEEHIVGWLEQCHAKAADHPPLRETTKQYLNLVKKITGQLTNDAMEQELKELIRQDFKAAALVSTYWEHVKSELVADYIKHFADAVVNQLGEGWTIMIETDTYISVVNKSYGKMTFRHRNWPKGGGVTLEGQSTMTNGRIIYGLMAVSGNEQFAKTEFVKDNGVKNKWWYAYTTLMNISTPEVLADLAEKRAPTAFVVENKVAAVVDLCQKCHQALL